MNRFTYEISNDLVLEMWDNENTNEKGAPWLRQPFHPDARPWSDRKEVEDFAEDYILILLGLKQPEKQPVIIVQNPA